MRINLYVHTYLRTGIRFPDRMPIVTIYFICLGKIKKKQISSRPKRNILNLGFAFWKIKLFLIPRFFEHPKTLDGRDSLR